MSGIIKQPRAQWGYQTLNLGLGIGLNCSPRRLRKRTFFRGRSNGTASWATGASRRLLTKTSTRKRETEAIAKVRKQNQIAKMAM